MDYKLTIDGRLPGLNEYQTACRRNRYGGNKMKKEQMDYIKNFIYDQLDGIHITKAVTMDYIWFEPNKKRDLDNISSFGRKCIQDALVEADVLKNDGWLNIVGFTDNFAVDEDNPHIDIYIRETI